MKKCIQTKRSWETKPLAQQTQSLVAQRANLVAKYVKSSAVADATRAKIDDLHVELEWQIVAEDRHRAALEACDVAIADLDVQAQCDGSFWTMDVDGSLVAQSTSEHAAVQAMLVRMRETSDVSAGASGEPPCAGELPVLSVPSTPPPKKAKVSHYIATPPDESPVISAVQEIDSDHEIVGELAPSQGGKAYGKGGARVGSDARTEAAPI
jgi:hypothetical protein